jgi:hypothetical protein
MKYIELYNFELKLVHGFLTNSHKLNWGINFLGGMNYFIIYFICFHQNYMSMVFVKILKVFFPKLKYFGVLKFESFVILKKQCVDIILSSFFFFSNKLHFSFQINIWMVMVIFDKLNTIFQKHRKLEEAPIFLVCQPKCLPFFILMKWISFGLDLSLQTLVQRFCLQ